MPESALAPAFLVAMDQLWDPTFRGSVVLMIHHDDQIIAIQHGCDRFAKVIGRFQVSQITAPLQFTRKIKAKDSDRAK